MKSKLFGVLLLIEAAALLLTSAVALHYQRVAGETDARCFLLTAALTASVGLLLYNIGNMSKRGTLQIRDTFFVVALSWVLFSLFGMLPFLMNGTVDNVTDAFFETMSGFSTTGATILNNIDQQPHGILFWRSITQWMGGLGVVVFTLAFLPSVAKGSKKVSLFAAEAPGLSVEKLAPTMGATSRLLWIIYIALTVLCAIAYGVGPMNRFDAICHAMTTIATGGFSTHQASIGYYQSSYLEWICSLFMLLSGINFAMYHFLFNRRFDVIRRNEELRWYLIAILVFILLFVGRFYFAPHFKTITEDQLASHPQTWWDRIRISLFHVVALLSNTGFQSSNCDYDTWGRLFLIPTVLLMVVGGCAGSTSGGIKMVRVIVLLKYVRKTIHELIHSSSMYTVKISGQIVEDLSLKRVMSFFSLFLIVFMLNVVGLSAAGMSLEEGAISFLTCFSNYGPGTGITGPSGTFDAIPNAAKWILSFDMMVGRLEIYTVLLLFTPSFWRTK
ncbi:MAG: TrkH family potassium uptake protein [Bacteroidales bacterium]|nr:TrkH family potassium uptake protein [Bacteroidales bacterium]